MQRSHKASKHSFIFNDHNFFYSYVFTIYYTFILCVLKGSMTLRIPFLSPFRPTYATAVWSLLYAFIAVTTNPHVGLRATDY